MTDYAVIAVVCGTNTTTMAFKTYETALAQFENMGKEIDARYPVIAIQNEEGSMAFFPLHAITAAILQTKRKDWQLDQMADAMVEQAEIQQRAQKKMAARPQPIVPVRDGGFQ